MCLQTRSVICKMIVGNGLPRQCAHWLAMTVVVGSRNDYRTSTSFRGRLRPWESVSQHRKRRKIYYESYWGARGARYSGGRSDLSEWQRSTDEEGFSKPTKMSGTATGFVRRVEEYGIIGQISKNRINTGYFVVFD